MKDNFRSRTELMLGKDACDRLANSRIAVFGIGGVGGYATEALARAGVGALDLIDCDRVSVTNINRQIIATVNTVGQYKTEAAKDRILSINPDCKVTCHNIFYTAGEGSVDLSVYDYIIDAIDAVPSKVALIEEAKEKGVKIISAMGAANKLDPTRFKVADISKTSVCPLARAVRLALRKKGIFHHRVVFSDEPSIGDYAPSELKNKDESDAFSKPITDSDAVLGNESKNGTAESESDRQLSAYESRQVPGSLSFVPSVMGLIIAGEVIKDISVI